MFSPSTTGIGQCYRDNTASCGNDANACAAGVQQCISWYLGPSGICKTSQAGANGFCDDIFKTDKVNCATTFSDQLNGCPPPGLCNTQDDCNIPGYDAGTVCVDGHCVTPGDDGGGGGECDSCNADWQCSGGQCDNDCCLSSESAGGGGPGGCSWNNGASCGICGSIGCDGSCTDPCNSGSSGGDACANAGCPNGCIDIEYMGREEAECQDWTDPIAIDLDNAGFPLTSVAKGVRFDFNGTGKPIQIAWTAASTNVGWLVLDRNGDGVINNGLEMFSNVTPQAGLAGTHLGFKALAQYDMPGNGGNRNGWIDAADTVFPKLRLWIDRNHNGISEPAELLTLAQAGIDSISVHYLKDNRTDAYGNRFMNKSQVRRSQQGNGNGKGQGQGGGSDQWAYDVILQSAK
jgi:hypothetical protein